MRTGKILLLSALALLGFSFIAQSRAAGFLNYYIKSAALTFQGLVPILRLDIGISNPSNQTFTVNSIVGKLYANDFDIGNVTSFAVVTIPPRGTAVYPLFIRLNLLGVVSDIVKLFQGSDGGGNSQLIEFEGGVNANGILSDLDIKYKIA